MAKRRRSICLISFALPTLSNQLFDGFTAGLPVRGGVDTIRGPKTGAGSSDRERGVNP